MVWIGFCVNMQLGKLEKWNKGENRGKQGRKAKTQGISHYSILWCKIRTTLPPCANFWAATQSSLAQEISAIRSQQEHILITQTQHTAILRQLQHHLGLPSATEHLTPTTAVLHSEATEPHAPPDPNTENAETSTWAISLPASFSPFLIIYILYFMYFFYNSIFWCLIF